VGWMAFRLALAGFIVPFFFIYQPGMLLMGPDAAGNLILNGASFLTIVQSVVFGLIGVWYLAVSVEGYFLIKFPMWLRPIFFIGAILLIAPGFILSLSGLVLGLIGIGIILLLKKNSGNVGSAAAA